METGSVDAKHDLSLGLRRCQGRAVREADPGPAERKLAGAVSETAAAVGQDRFDQAEIQNSLFDASLPAIPPRRRPWPPSP